MALVLLGGLAVAWIEEKIVWLLVIVGSFFLIRWLADVFWWGRDNNRW